MSYCAILDAYNAESQLGPAHGQLEDSQTVNMAALPIVCPRLASYMNRSIQGKTDGSNDDNVVVCAHG